ncbi:Conserved_hypothetical protein [Hexamita inflata]|uniref:Uncharacterized protein n=1 Tax=Hexamita inflata TaxID=28002 RepID=A0AA86PYE9_9EUKA|nr:Conserved hypothetical protein [Hexamita inflata]
MKLNNTCQWQSDFERQFIKLVKQRAVTDIHDATHAFSLFESDGENIKSSFWIEMSTIMNVSHKKLHDYYHNTWSKRFYTEIGGYKVEITNMIDLSNNQDTVKDIVKNVVYQLERRHKNCRFHYNTVYQFVNYKIKSKEQVSIDSSISNSSKVISNEELDFECILTYATLAEALEYE